MGLVPQGGSQESKVKSNIQQAFWRLENSTKEMNCLQQRLAIQSCGMGILPVLVLLAGFSSRATRNFGIFF
jgi:hypothetical protein